MKIKIIIITCLLFLGTGLFIACEHEIPQDFCSTDPISLTVVKTDASNNQNNGVIIATATGGSGIQFSLNGSAYTDNGEFTGLEPYTSYRVVARNSWGCTDTSIVEIGVVVPVDPCAGITVSVQLAKTNASPNQANGTITATVSPAGNYTFSINNSAFQPIGNFTGLATGVYTIAAKNANGCIGTAQATIGVNDPCAGVVVTVNTTKVDPVLGQSNGSITATATGGAGFSYSLNNGAFQTSGIFTGLPTGNYTITAKNSNGCTGVATVSLGSVNPCAGVTVVVSATSVNPASGQSNGSITASATGGTGFTYSLNNGPFQTSGTFSGLAAGNYTITAKNSNGCTGVKTIALGSANPCTGVNIVVSLTKVDPALGQSNGSISATATGGTGFTYSLNGGTYQAGATFSSLAAGTYTVTAKSSQGCIGSATITLTTVNPCNGVIITVTATKVNPTGTLSNGSITATASGATGFTYKLNNGAYQPSGTFSGLAAGTYTITAKSSAGCTGATTVTLTATNSCTNTVINVSTSVINVLPCTTPAANGKITVTASGSSGFTFNINGGTYQAGNVFSNLAAGNFTIGVKDLNGCTKTATATVGTTAKGPLFSDVRTLITSRCGGSNCHMNGGNKAGYNFDNDCSIVTSWSPIYNSCVTSNSMPNSPQPQLTTAEKQKITNWVNAGHTYGN